MNEINHTLYFINIGKINLKIKVMSKLAERHKISCQDVVALKSAFV
jgi:hypothetical protein